MNYIILTYATVLTCLTMVAQTTKKAKAPVSNETQPGEAYSNTEFDPTVAHLPAGFKGDDIRSVSSELERRESTGKKGEFESTAQWTERLRATEAQPILGNLTPNSTYVFIIGQNDPEYNQEPHVLYDADAEKFNISIQAAPLKYLSERQEPGNELTLPVWQSESAVRTYIGSNGFGAEREVTEYSHKEYRLILSNGDAFGLIRGEVSIPRAMAKIVKPQIRLVAVCKLVELKSYRNPYVSSGSHMREATLDDPDSWIVDYHYLSVRLLAIWLCNQDTGTVYARIRPAYDAL